MDRIIKYIAFKKQGGFMMNTLYTKYHTSKFNSALIGLLFALSAVPFAFLGLLILSKYGTTSNLLWVPFIGILGSLITGFQSMFQRKQEYEISAK